jgi:hypothetical protein
MHREIFMLFLLLILALVALFIWSLQLRYKRRELLHRERLAALEKGVDLPALTDAAEAPWTPRVYLLRGLMWLLSGIAIGIFLVGASFAARRVERPDEQMWRVQGMKHTLGLSDEQVKALLTEAPRERDGLPVPIALFGLIPAAIGAAYLVVYRVERKGAQPPQG